jgi:epoxyqueuosine reductase
VTPDERSRLVKQRAHDLGFESVGICDLRPTPHADALHSWLANGYAGTMTYMHRQAARRTKPAEILPGATRAVVVTRGYFEPDTPRRDGAGHVAKYARGADYHDALRPGLDTLATYVRSLGNGDTLARAYVDAGPVPERELAQRAGLGWIGKNTMLILPTSGSFSFLATVLTNLDLATDEPFEADRCGTCRKCLDACPTAAFPAARVLDSRRCISYLTIEYRGDPPPDAPPSRAGWIFGCDDCQDVCPWNQKFARPAEDPVLAYDPDLEWLDLTDLLAMDDAGFAARFGATPLARPGGDGMRRNARTVAIDA